MLTVELDPDQDAVTISFDEDGLDLLVKRLEMLRKGSGHDHLMTASWAGTELDENPVGSGTMLKHHLRLVRLPV